MKRLRLDDSSIVKEGNGSTLYRQSLSNPVPLSYTTSATGCLKTIGEGMQSSLYTSTAPVNYGTMPTATAPAAPVPHSGHSQIRSSPPSVNACIQEPTAPQPQQQSPGGNSNRLKVEDALSYLDLVKFKFNNTPQVYNGFLDIMKEFKSQSIDTPGVIQRVSNLFKGFPDLIIGFNTFLPPGYKIEVQRGNEGCAFQVPVSLPSPTGGADNQHKTTSMILKGPGIINSSVSSGGQLPPAATAAVVPTPVVPAANLQIATPQQPSPAAIHQASGYVPAATAPTYNSLTLSAAQAAVNQALHGHSDATTTQNQPVEFNHAINYVNKIKNRFQGQPEKYKRFLEILHTYQKEQRTLKETTPGGLGGKQLTEQEVYSQVAKLFENQSDLLAEFGQFLPDATSHMNQVVATSEHGNLLKKPPPKLSGGYSREGGGIGAIMEHQPPQQPLQQQQQRHRPSSAVNHVIGSGVHSVGGGGQPSIKRSSPSYATSTMHRDGPPPPKKNKFLYCRDVSLAEAGKYGTLNDYAFFDKVRKAVKSHDAYVSFLRCLGLFTQEVVSKTELVHMVTPFLGKFPELMKWFRDFVGQSDATAVETVPSGVAQSERPKGDAAQEIDLTTAKRLGASYCVIPVNEEGRQCSGRTELCREVLNDRWVSFPTWSEDSTFVSSRKTQYEEYMYRCEDERFELDVVIETNASTIRVFEAVNKKLSRMNPDELAKYRLDDNLGGTSSVLHQRSLRRVYGDRAADIIDGLKKNPGIAIPVVLRRLKIKEEEWREAQKGFNKVWRDQNEKYYLKSLDHQGINFKPTDVKALRSKSLMNEIETLYDERHEQNEDGGMDQPSTGPHLVVPYKDRSILDDAANLLIHNVKRQTGIQKSEKRRIKHLLLQFLPDFFFHPRQHLSEDEREEEEEKEESDENTAENFNDAKSSKCGISPSRSETEHVEIKEEPVDAAEEDSKTPPHALTTDPEEAYTLFMGNTNWYLFLRLHAILCERLTKIYDRAVILAQEEARDRSKRKESTAIALRLRPKPQIEIEEYYPAFLDMVKNLLDGNMDSNTYEDTLREMFGIHAYIAFTLDKVVSYAVRQLQHCVTERTALACMEMFTKEQKRGAAGGPCVNAYKRLHLEAAYQRMAEKTVHDDSCFKIYIYKNDCRMTFELLDSDNDNIEKKVDDAKKWSSYKECYSNCTSSSTMNKMKSPVFLERNLRLYKKRVTKASRSPQGDEETTKTNNDPKTESEKDYEFSLQELERKLNERSPPERNQSNHGGYQVSDETECKFNPQDSKIVFTSNKDSFIYKIGALAKAKKSHPAVTKKMSGRFKNWLKQWTELNVSEVEHKECTDWLMGRAEGVVPNRTKVLIENNTSRTPYVPYNRYKVERLSNETS